MHFVIYSFLYRHDLSSHVSLSSDFVSNNNVQGDHNSPGIIPLAIKDVFSMIQDVRLFS